MQRRNFKMPSRNYQQTQVRGNAPRQELKRGLDQWMKGLRSARQDTKDIVAPEADPRPQPDDGGRWQDDGGKGG
jgi:hypothetical protein